MRHLECWVHSSGALYRRCHLPDAREPGASGHDGRHLRKDSCLHGPQLHERVSNPKLKIVRFLSFLIAVLGSDLSWCSGGGGRPTSSSRQTGPCCGRTRLRPRTSRRWRICGHFGFADPPVFLARKPSAGSERLEEGCHARIFPVRKDAMRGTCALAFRCKAEGDVADFVIGQC